MNRNPTGDFVSAQKTGSENMNGGNNNESPYLDSFIYLNFKNKSLRNLLWGYTFVFS